MNALNRTNERTNERKYECMMQVHSVDVAADMQVLRHMCEGLVALLMDRADYHKFMMRSVARDLLASLVFRPLMQHMTPYNINKVFVHCLVDCD